MLLSDLKWEAAETDHDQRVAAINDTTTIWQRRDGLYDIWGYDIWGEDKDGDNVERDNLTEIEAQAVLFHLTNEVTTNPTKETEV